MNTATAESWPSAWIVPPATGERRGIAKGAVDYNNAVHRIQMLLLSSAAALVDHDYIQADHDRHEAWETMRTLSPLIDAAEREVCLPTDECKTCGSPSQHRCTCAEWDGEF